MEKRSFVRWLKYLKVKKALMRAEIFTPVNAYKDFLDLMYNKK